MPFSSQSITGNNLRTKTSLRIPIDTGILRSLSAINQKELTEFHDNYIRIGITKTGDTPVGILVVLAQGYCDGMNSVTWSGKIPFEPEMELFLDLWSSSGSTINLAYITEL